MSRRSVATTGLEGLPDPVVLPSLLDTATLHGLGALLVDDVADTGETLALVHQPLGAGNGVTGARGARRAAMPARV